MSRITQPSNGKTKNITANKAPRDWNPSYLALSPRGCHFVTRVEHGEKTLKSPNQEKGRVVQHSLRPQTKTWVKANQNKCMAAKAEKGLLKPAF